MSGSELLLDGDLYYENIICPSCGHEMEVETNENNFITYEGKTSDEWDDLKCPECGLELIVGIVSVVMFHTIKKERKCLIRNQKKALHKRSS